MFRSFCAFVSLWQVFMSLFQPIPERDTFRDRTRPLADRMRPRSLEEFIGQEHLLGPGKTTLAKIIASVTRAEFIEFSAVLAGIKEIKQVMSDAERARQYGTRTIVFIDEI